MIPEPVGKKRYRTPRLRVFGPASLLGLSLAFAALGLSACFDSDGSEATGPGIDTTSYPPPGPVFTLHPQDTTIVEGGTATFRVGVTGATSYRWVNDLGDTLPGDTTATLTLTNVPLTADGTTYKSVARNAGGSATSRFAILNVSPAPAPLHPVITAQPVSSIIIPGGSTLLNVSATGQGLVYQWFRSNQDWPLPHQNSPTLLLTSAPHPGETQTYYCVVSNPHGYVNSDTVTVRADAPRAFLLDTGAVLYTDNCAGCHGPHGRGAAGLVPPLANADFLMQNRARSIDIVLAGTSDSLLVNGLWYHDRMPAWAHELSDVQIAAVLTWIRVGLNDSTVTSCNANQRDADGFAACAKTPRSPQAIAADSVSYQEVFNARMILDPL